MRRLPRYNLVEQAERKVTGSKQAGVLSSSSSLLGDDSGKKKTKDIVSENGYNDYRNGNHYADEEGDEGNPWVSASSVSTATLRSRHYGPKSSHGFAYSHDGDADSWSLSGSNRRERNPEQETRRRRRSRSATASTSKHPLYVDGDVDLEERHHYHSRSETQSPGLFSSIYDHQTRPSLRRAIGSLEGHADEDTSEVIRGDKRPATLDVDVIVHKVMRTDTLAGIALKYNIPLAKLRRANKLWANDSIHLRPILYIPLRDVLSPSSLSNTPSSKSNPVSPFSEHCKMPSESELDANNNTSQNDSSSATHTQDEIQKVPLSQLSFFPPSGASNTPASIPTSHFTFNNDNTQLTLPPTRSGFNSSPAFSFTSLIQGLNNATQEIKSRISFDSYSSKHSSDHGEDGEIELDTVKIDQNGKRYRLERGTGGGGDIPYPSLSTFIPEDPRTPLVNLQHPSLHPDKSSSIVMSPPLPSPSTPKKAIIRTVQLQPSPEMKIPTTKSRDRGKNKITGLHKQEFQEAEIDSDTQ